MATKSNSIGKLLGKPKEIRTYAKNNLLVIPDTFIGIEIELEGLPEGERLLEEDSYWSIHQDNSLRNYDGVSHEFVLSYPLCGEDLILALRQFDRMIKSLSAPPITSERTSVHVHLDVRDLSAEQLYALILLYCTFERVLFTYCGKDRESNPFCLPFYLAEGVAFDMLAALSDEDGVRRVAASLGDTYRYAALNLCSLRKFGSLEFRHCGGTYNVVRILEWINIIMCLKKYVKENTIIFDEFPAKVSDLKYSGVIKEVFKDYGSKLMYSGVEKDILQGIRQAQKVIHATKTENILKNFVKLVQDTNKKNTLVNNYLTRKWGLTKKLGNKTEYPEKYPENVESWATTNTSIVEMTDTLAGDITSVTSLIRGRF